MTGLASPIGFVLWWPLSVISIATWITVEVITSGRSTDLERHLQKQLQLQPGPDDSRIGLVRGLEVLIYSDIDDLAVRVMLPPPCLRLTLGRNLAPTGDPVFDARFSVGGIEPAWRLVLRPDLRSRLLASFANMQTFSISGGYALARVPGSTSSEDIVAIAQEMVDVAHEITARLSIADPFRDLLALTPREPCAAVRRGHYEWLVASNFDVPDVLRKAASDPDAEIAAWAKSQMAPSTMYR